MRLAVALGMAAQSALGGLPSRDPSEHEDLEERVAHEALLAVYAPRHLAGREAAGHGGLAVLVELHAAQAVVQDWIHQYRVLADVVAVVEEHLHEVREALAGEARAVDLVDPRRV